nr:hypothetical protein [Streptomyces rochei]
MSSQYAARKDSTSWSRSFSISATRAASGTRARRMSSTAAAGTRPSPACASEARISTFTQVA